jgi:hypothetical protein
VHLADETADPPDHSHCSGCRGDIAYARSRTVVVVDDDHSKLSSRELGQVVTPALSVDTIHS